MRKSTLSLRKKYGNQAKSSDVFQYSKLKCSNTITYETRNMNEERIACCEHFNNTWFLKSFFHTKIFKKKQHIKSDFMTFLKGMERKNGSNFSYVCCMK